MPGISDANSHSHPYTELRLVNFVHFFRVPFELYQHHYLFYYFLLGRRRHYSLRLPLPSLTAHVVHFGLEPLRASNHQRCWSDTPALAAEAPSIEGEEDNGGVIVGYCRRCNLFRRWWSSRRFRLTYSYSFKSLLALGQLYNSMLTLRFLATAMIFRNSDDQASLPHSVARQPMVKTQSILLRAPRRKAQSVL
jgi:hypothetical protein